MSTRAVFVSDLPAQSPQLVPDFKRPPRRINGRWQCRAKPATFAIADVLLADPAILNLRSRVLERDIREKYGVCHSTAATAIAIARHRMNIPVGMAPHGTYP